MAEEEDRWEYEIDVDDSDLRSLLDPPRPIPLSSSNPSQTLPLPSIAPCSQIPRSSQTLASKPNPNPTPLPNPPPSPLLSPCQAQPQSLIADAQEPEPPPKTAAPRLIPGPAGAVQAAMRRKSSAEVQVRGASSSEEQAWGHRGLDVDDEDEDFKTNPWLSAMDFLGTGRDYGSSMPIGSIKTPVAERVPLVVGIVKSCTPNGLGDLSLTLKDPTGTISASVHRRALTEGNRGGDISVGCVLILKQVVAFCRARSMCLNVTANNVAKLISKDCGPPQKQMLHSVFGIHHASGEHITPGSGTVEKEHLARHKTAAHQEIGRNLNWGKVISGDYSTGVAGSLPCRNSANAVTAMRTTKADPKPIEPKKLIPQVSVAQWTDEQLSELFSDYNDDAELGYAGS